MHIEIQIAVNFLVSFLYDKLPRRRVNLFGEELEAALKAKYEDHWYTEKPFKGSAFRCIRCAPPLDPIVFEVAAINSGMNLMDIQENLPQELSIWVDPGEVSFRSGEKGLVKILYSRKVDLGRREIKSELNPEAKCFKPTESPLISSPNQPLSAVANICPPINSFTTNKVTTNNSKPVVFTTAAFAATKFGSTKLKNLNKKIPRTSPTDCNFSKYQTQIYQQQVPQMQFSINETNHSKLFVKNGVESNQIPRQNTFFSNQSFESYENLLSFNQDPWNEAHNENLNNFPAPMEFSGGSTMGNPLETLKFEPNITKGKFNEESHRFEETWQKQPLLNYTELNQNVWETSQFPFLNDTIWNDILNGEETSTKITDGNETGKVLASANMSIPCNEGKVFSTSSFSSTMSSPSLSTSNESNLINEFDSMSLNSNGSGN